ncbi:hypothetical protein ACTU45_27425 [Streptomyces sp. 24-1644]|uniref:hypothetical protein n=1 Tax=Streptomyces sp. 24-1644 TaxID=3457315 RepID=UPI003FA6B781
MTGHVLSGGMANAGAVVRRGSVVERPAQPHAAAIHAHLRALAAHGFDGVPTPMGTTADGSREQLSYVHGDVPVPPHPPWAWTDDALRSVGALLRRMHRAAASAPIDRAMPWPTELADPEGPEAAEADGDAVYVRALEQGGGWARWDRHQDVLVAQREAFAAALAAT